MDRLASIDTSGTRSFDASNIMERDKEQSHRLHEPSSISSHTDPITGNDVIATTDHPYVVDGILTVYFESEETRRAYLDTPYNHPVLKITSKRPYKEAWSNAAAYDKIHELAGRAFDSDCVDALISEQEEVATIQHRFHEDWLG